MHLGLDQMADIFRLVHFHQSKFHMIILLFTDCVRAGEIENESVLVSIMAWIATKPLHDQFDLPI